MGSFARSVIIACDTQVLSRWQQASIPDLAARQPDSSQKSDCSHDALLIQSIPVHEPSGGVSAVTLVGDPCLDAVPVAHRRSGPFCLRCSAQRTCRHIKAMSGDIAAELVSAEARDAAWIEKFAAVFDMSTGQRRVTSISQVSSRPHSCSDWNWLHGMMCATQALIAEPSCHDTSGPEAAVMDARAAGTSSLPWECIPCFMEGSQCACGALWADANKCVATRQGVQSYMFHMAKFQPVTVYQLTCQCGQSLDYDGKEDAVFNLNHVDLFTHEVLKWYRAALTLSHCPSS